MEMRKYQATCRFTLGSTGVVINKGDEVQSDGTRVIAGGTEAVVPQIKGAINAQWLVPIESYDGKTARPKSAGIQIRSAVQTNNTPGVPPSKRPITTIEEDEQVVGTQSDRESIRAGRTPKKVAEEAAIDREALQEQLATSDDGVPVRSIKTPAKQKNTLTPDSAGEAIRAAGKATTNPGKSITEEEMLSKMTPEKRKEYLDKKEALRAPYLADAAAKLGNPNAVKSSPKVIQKEGITLTASVGGGISTEDASDPSAKPTTSTSESEGIRFQGTNLKKPEAKVIGAKGQEIPKAAKEAPKAAKAKAPELSPAARLKVAKAIYSKFPKDYDFDKPAKKKVALLRLNYEDKPDVVKAAFSAEADDVRVLIATEFPEYFTG